MYLLSTFKKKEKSTKQLRNTALLSGALTTAGLAEAGIDIKKAANLEKNINSKLAKNKAAMVASHPDKFIGKDESVISKARQKFQQLSNEKDELKKLKDSTDELKNLKGIKKLKRAIGINIENKTKSKLTDLAEQQSKQLGKKVAFTPNQQQKIVSLAKKFKKLSYAATALGTVGTGIATAKYINRKRKERNDKGRKRGKYSK